MKSFNSRSLVLAPLAAALLGAAAPPAEADAITDWNQRSAQIIGESRIGTPPAVRVMALVQTAAYEAARDASRFGPASTQAVDAAIAAAHRTVFTQLLPAQRVTVDAAFQTAVAAMPDDAVRAQQIAVGEKAAQRVLAERSGDMPRAADTYRPHTTPGAYVPTALPAVTLWPQRKPWLLHSVDQFRPDRAAGADERTLGA